VDVSEIPAPKVVTAARSTKILGYVGTIAAWFDWDWVIALAKARPTDVVRLIGPVFTRVPTALPKNIEILPPRPHQAAMEAMRDFDVGLIPFQKSGLTESVDPIKYYEYRALGLPVLSTAFGEMKRREGEKGTFVTSDASKTPGLVEKALSYRTDEDEIRRFSEATSWETRFGAANIL
jgi:hypothetical protein